MFKLKFNNKHIQKLAKVTNIKRYNTITLQPDIIVPHILTNGEGITYYKVSKLIKRSPKNNHTHFVKVGNTQIPITNALSRKTLDMKYTGDHRDYNKIEIIADGNVTVPSLDLTGSTYLPGKHCEQSIGTYDHTLDLLNKHNLNYDVTSLDNHNCLYETIIWNKKENDTIHCINKQIKSGTHIPYFADNIQSLLDEINKSIVKPSSSSVQSKHDSKDLYSTWMTILNFVAFFFAIIGALVCCGAMLCVLDKMGPLW